MIARPAKEVGLEVEDLRRAEGSRGEELYISLLVSSCQRNKMLWTPLFPCDPFIAPQGVTRLISFHGPALFKLEGFKLTT